MGTPLRFLAQKGSPRNVFFGGRVYWYLPDTFFGQKSQGIRLRSYWVLYMSLPHTSIYVPSSHYIISMYIPPRVVCAAKNSVIGGYPKSGAHRYSSYSRTSNYLFSAIARREYSVWCSLMEHADARGQSSLYYRARYLWVDSNSSNMTLSEIQASKADMEGLLVFFRPSAIGCCSIL